MAEVLLRFEQAVRGRDGRAYRAQACGREVAGGLWEGWIEFAPEEGGEPLRTPRETDQPNRTDLEYWASGLESTYLEGALERALDPVAQRPREPGPPGAAHYAGPARPVDKRRAAVPVRPVLNPFNVFRQGEAVLREELGALDENHLRTIVRGYAMKDPAGRPSEQLDRTALVELIVSRARERFER